MWQLGRAAGQSVSFVHDLVQTLAAQVTGVAVVQPNPTHVRPIWQAGAGKKPPGIGHDPPTSRRPPGGVGAQCAGWFVYCIQQKASVPVQLVATFGSQVVSQPPRKPVYERMSSTQLEPVEHRAAADTLPSRLQTGRQSPKPPSNMISFWQRRPRRQSELFWHRLPDVTVPAGPQKPWLDGV
jgi:hypothetical protein